MSSPSNRLIVLGASNVARGLPALLDAGRVVFDGPVEIVAAQGHGRSYGLESRFLGRFLPGILDCGLWPILDSGSSGRTVALICDVGNDIFYGVTPARLTNWVEECVERLQGSVDELLLVRPPITRLASLSRAGYETARRLFFPARPLAYESALESVADLDLRLGELAERRCIQVMAPSADWYALDPIHITRRARPDAWREMLSRMTPRHGVETAASEKNGGSILESARVHSARPARVRFLGLELGVEQPVRRLSDGSSLLLF